MEAGVIAVWNTLALVDLAAAKLLRQDRVTGLAAH